MGIDCEYYQNCLIETDYTCEDIEFELHNSNSIPKEFIISEKVLQSIRSKCIDAGRKGRQVFTVRGPDGGMLVRCKYCGKKTKLEDGCMKCNHFNIKVDPDNYCSWGEIE